MCQLSPPAFNQTYNICIFLLQAFYSNRTLSVILSHLWHFKILTFEVPSHLFYFSNLSTHLPLSLSPTSYSPPVVSRSLAFRSPLSSPVLFLGLTTDFLGGYKSSTSACLPVLYSLLVNFCRGKIGQMDERVNTDNLWEKRVHILVSVEVFCVPVCVHFYILCEHLLTNGKGCAESSFEPLL